MSEVEAAWLAGLLEGEGCFVLKSGRQNGYAAIRCSMTDLDVIERITEVTGVGCVSEQKVPAGGKPAWTWVVSRRSVVASICRRIRPHMGVRRSEKIGRIMAAIEGSKNSSI